MLTQEEINVIAQFMSRTELKASEIEAYQSAMQALQRAFQEQKEGDYNVKSVPVEG